MMHWWNTNDSLTYLIFVIFSPHIQSLVSFFSTQKCVNRVKTDFATNSVNHDKTNFSTKQHNVYTFKDILHIIHMPAVEKLQISPHLSCEEIRNYSTYGETSDFATSLVHINLKFLHMTNFSPHISLVILVTNIRYVVAMLILVFHAWWN